MMFVMSVVLVMLTTMQVFLGILVEGRFASWGAEIICCTFVIRFPLGCLFVNIHFTYWINRHSNSTPFHFRLGSIYIIRPSCSQIIERLISVIWVIKMRLMWKES